MICFSCDQDFEYKNLQFGCPYCNAIYNGIVISLERYEDLLRKESLWEMVISDRSRQKARELIGAHNG